MDIDIGTKAIREDFCKDDQDVLVRPLIRTFSQKLNDVFQGLEIKGHKVQGNPEGELVGKWSDGNMYTMTHQSVLLGIPAMQLEIPRSLRALLIREKVYMSQLAKCILSTYKEVVEPLWKQKKTDIILNYSLAKQLQEVKLNNACLAELADIYYEWDSKCEDLLI